MKSPEQTRAECAARDARVDGMFDRIELDMRRIFKQMKADGLIRDPGTRTRVDDFDGLGYEGNAPMPRAVRA